MYKEGSSRNRISWTGPWRGRDSRRETGEAALVGAQKPKVMDPYCSVSENVLLWGTPLILQPKPWATQVLARFFFKFCFIKQNL